LLACDGVLSTRGTGVRPVFDRLFREYGLPRAMRTDNGVPFASTSLHGLTPLNVWWLCLGIQHQRILPAHPQQNGAHEWMHKTLKPPCVGPRAPTCGRKARVQSVSRGVQPRAPAPIPPPAARRAHSIVRHPGPTRALSRPMLAYPSHYTVKRVTNAGTIRFKTQLLYLSTALRQHRVALDEEVEDGIWSLYFCDVLLGRIDERTALRKGQLGVTHVLG
jgi:putative transposase